MLDYTCIHCIYDYCFAFSFFAHVARAWCIYADTSYLRYGFQTISLIPLPISSVEFLLDTGTFSSSSLQVLCSVFYSLHFSIPCCHVYTSYIPISSPPPCLSVVLLPSGPDIDDLHIGSTAEIFFTNNADTEIPHNFILLSAMLSMIPEVGYT